MNAPCRNVSDQRDGLFLFDFRLFMFLFVFLFLFSSLFFFNILSWIGSWQLRCVPGSAGAASAPRLRSSGATRRPLGISSQLTKQIHLFVVNARRHTNPVELWSKWLENRTGSYVYSFDWHLEIVSSLSFLCVFFLFVGHISFWTDWMDSFYLFSTRAWYGKSWRIADQILKSQCQLVVVLMAFESGMLLKACVL